MKFKKYYEFLFLVFLGIILLTPQVQALSINTKTSTSSDGSACTGPEIVATITQAEYTDLQGNGYQNDIFAQVQFDLYCVVRANFNYYITLILPSGTSFTYSALINTGLNHIWIDNYFYNYAYETGWYKINISILQKTGGLQLLQTSNIFDPPGGTGAERTLFYTMKIY